MLKLNFLLFLGLLLISFSAYGKANHTISGTIRDSENGEALIRATVSEPNLKAGGYTNTYGFYSLTLPEGEHTLRISYVGYKAVEKKIKLSKDITLNFEINPVSTTMEEIIVFGERKDVALTETTVGIEKVSMSRIEKVPVLLGERDVMKTIQLMPGISTTSEGSTGFSVRGGSTDQNLVLLDEATVYSQQHLKL